MVTYEFSIAGLDMWRDILNKEKGCKGSKILMIPGFWAGDQSLYPLAWRLREAGHRVFFAGIWWNTGCPRDTMEHLSQAVRALHLTGGQKLAILGHSLGGIYARELARRVPEMVERIVLLGSAIRHPLANTNPMILSWYLVSRRPHPDGGDCLESLATLCGTHQLEPPGVPETIIYSRRDEVVAWNSCLESGPNVETLEVNSSHYTMPYLPEVWRIILGRLNRSPADLLVRPRPYRAGPWLRPFLLH